MRRQLLIDGFQRTYELRIPVRKTRIFYPLVLLFHGRGTNGRIMLSRTRFAAKAEAEGFIVAAPDGLNGHWNDGRGTVNPNVDDIGFIRQLVASLTSQLPVDVTRIYAAGISNGGIFAQRLACEISDILVAVGTVAGPLAANLARSRPNPISIVGIQGDEDPRVPIDGTPVNGRAGQLESAVNTMNFWSSINSCNLTPTVTRIAPVVDDGTSIDKYTYSGGLADVVYYIVHGMGHAWPPYRTGGNEYETGVTSRNINATDVIWKFLYQHSRVPREAGVPSRPFMRLGKRSHGAKMHDYGIAADDGPDRPLPRPGRGKQMP